MATSIPQNTSSPASTANAAFADVPQSVALNPYARLVTDLSGLSLANGMTAGYGDNDGHIDNPNAWPGTYGGNPRWSYFPRVGVMRNVPGTLPGGQIFSLYFIFNPNQITASFAVDTSQIPAQYIYGTSDTVGTETHTAAAVAPNAAQNQTLTWSLLFDRTYDMLYDTNPDENRGVLVDVAAFYNLLATFDSNAAVPVSTPVQVVFGQTASGQLWGFTGFITQGIITYGMFRHNMIPSRCTIDITMMTNYVAPQSATSGSSAAAIPGTPAALASILSGGINLNPAGL